MSLRRATDPEVVFSRISSMFRGVYEGRDQTFQLRNAVVHTHWRGGRRRVLALHTISRAGGICT